MEPMIVTHMSTLVEKEEGKEEEGIFTNVAVVESEKGTSLSEDIKRGLGGGQETQILKMTFDDLGEETKL